MYNLDFFSKNKLNRATLKKFYNYFILSTLINAQFEGKTKLSKIKLLKGL